MAKWVYRSATARPRAGRAMRDLLGGKGANLAEMCSLGLPVPPGFTITTEVCDLLLRQRQAAIPPELKARSRRRCGTSPQVDRPRRSAMPTNPLLVSVRSGARASMPGMMDTVLNLGLNDETVEALAATAGDARFAYDSYRRFIQMYSDVVLGLDHQHVRGDPRGLQEPARARARHRARRPSDWRNDRRRTTRTMVEDELGKPFPQDPHEQLWGAIGAVFASWMNARAITYRRLHDIPESWGTAVNVQAMVFGNMGETSATGVAFTRNPSTGEKALYGEFLVNAQGEDVVAGIRTPQNIDRGGAHRGRLRQAVAAEALMPEAFAELREHLRAARRRTTATCRTSSSPSSSGKLWMLQTRSGKRTAKAALKIAVDMAKEGLITREEAISRIDPASLDQLLHPTIDPKAERDRHRHRPAGLAGRRHRRDRVLLRRGRGAEGAGAQGHPGAHRDQPGGHPRHARRRGHPDHARRHDQPRRRGGARHGQALRLRRRRAARRLAHAAR